MSGGPKCGKKSTQTQTQKGPESNMRDHFAKEKGVARAGEVKNPNMKNPSIKLLLDWG